MKSNLRSKFKIMDNYLVMKERENSAKEIEIYFVIKKGPKREALQDIIRECHMRRMPNDWTYSTIKHLVSDALGYTWNNESEFTEYSHEVIDGTVDIYNRELYDWYGAGNQHWVCEAKENGLCDVSADIETQMKAGQFSHIEAILGVLMAGLEDL